MTNHMFLFNPCFSVVNEGTSSLLNVGNNSPHYSAPYLWSPEFILIKFVEQELILWMAQKSLDLCLFFSILVIDLFVNVFFYFFCFIFFSFLIFCCCWGGLGYIFGCDLISYGLTLLSLWICVLVILARESIFRLGYSSGGFFLNFCCYCSYNYVILYL